MVTHSFKQVFIENPVCSFSMFRVCLGAVNCRFQTRRKTHFVGDFLFLFLFFKNLYLFMIVTEREREAETQAEEEAGSMHREPDVGFDPGSPGSCPGPKAGAKPLRHPGIPCW